MDKLKLNIDAVLNITSDELDTIAHSLCGTKLTLDDSSTPTWDVDIDNTNHIRATVNNCYSDSKSAVELKLNATITNTGTTYLRILDPEVKKIVANKMEAAAVTDGNIKADDFKTITNISNWFKDNEYIINFDELSKTGVITIDNRNSFQNCINLESIDTSKIEYFNDYYAFDNTKISKLDVSSAKQIKGFQYDSGGQINTLLIKDLNLWLRCNNHLVLARSIMQNDVIKIGTSFEDCHPINNIPNFPSDITKIPSCAFYRCSQLTSIPDLTGIYNISMNAFAYSGLNGRVDLATVDTLGSITDITYGEGCFLYCNGITEVNAPNVINMTSGCFLYCSNLNKIYLPKLLTILSPNYDYWLRGCANDAIVIFKNLNLLFSINWGYAQQNPLYYTNKLYIGNSLDDYQEVTEIDSLPNTLGPGCLTGLLNITINNVDFTNKIIKQQSFYGNKCLDTIDLSTAKSVELYSLFQYCTAKKIILSSSNITDTKLRDTFRYAYDVRNILLPNTITDILASAFAETFDLHTIKLPSSLLTIQTNGNFLYTPVIIYDGNLDLLTLFPEITVVTYLEFNNNYLTPGYKFINNAYYDKGNSSGVTIRRDTYSTGREAILIHDVNDQYRDLSAIKLIDNCKDVNITYLFANTVSALSTIIKKDNRNYITSYLRGGLKMNTLYTDTLHVTKQEDIQCDKYLCISITKTTANIKFDPLNLTTLTIQCIDLDDNKYQFDPTDNSWKSVTE